jgi:hypothetical protein
MDYIGFDLRRQEKWRRTWIYKDDIRYADLLAVMWKDMELYGNFTSVVYVLEAIKKIVHDNRGEKPSLGLGALDLLLSDALKSILELYEQIPDADLFMYNQGLSFRLVIDPEYVQERQNLDET